MQPHLLHRQYCWPRMCSHTCCTDSTVGRTCAATLVAPTVLSAAHVQPHLLHRQYCRPHMCSPTCCTDSTVGRTCISVSQWNDLGDTVQFDGVGLAGFKSWANVFLLALAACALLVFDNFHFLFFLPIWVAWYCGTGVSGRIGCKSLFPCLA